MPESLDRRLTVSSRKEVAVHRQKLVIDLVEPLPKTETGNKWIIVLSQ